MYVCVLCINIIKLAFPSLEGLAVENSAGIILVTIDLQSNKDKVAANLMIRIIFNEMILTNNKQYHIMTITMLIIINHNTYVHLQ